MRKIIMLLIVLLSTTSFFAQKQVRHEFWAWGNIGISTLKYKTSISTNRQQPGGGIGVGYNYSISQYLGINTGLEVVQYSTKSTVIKLYDKEEALDETENEYFEFRTTINNYKEKQTAFYLNVPIMIQYQSSGNKKYYVAIGGKIGFPVGTKYEILDVTIENSGYYPAINQEFTDQEFRGFGTFSGGRGKKNLGLKIAYIASIETGIKWKLNKNNISIYTGLFLDYGINDISKKKYSNLVSYNSSHPENFNTNSILTSEYTKDNERKLFVDKVTPLAMGIKIKIAIGRN